MIDPGAIHSFTSYMFASRLEVESVMLDYMLIVSTPTSGTLCTNVIYIAFGLEIAGRKLEVNLILLAIKDFDVILGMD